jgi:hypothetical protein
MPSKTAKQKRFMAMCASPKGRKKAKGKCPPMKVAKKYASADKRARSRKK